LKAPPVLKFAIEKERKFERYKDGASTNIFKLKRSLTRREVPLVVLDIIEMPKTIARPTTGVNGHLVRFSLGHCQRLGCWLLDQLLVWHPGQPRTLLQLHKIYLDFLGVASDDSWNCSMSLQRPPPEVHSHRPSSL